MERPTPGYTLFRCRECKNAFEMKPFLRPRKVETNYCVYCERNTKHDTSK